MSAPLRFFSIPPEGRRILAGFSYLQLIKKGAQTRVWFPRALDMSRVEWAAARQFEIFQEGSNFAIENLEVTEIARSFKSWGAMRGGGYRVVILTLGCYTNRSDRDDLQILDQKIQEEVTRLINFLYLSEQSIHASAQRNEQLWKGEWHVREALPHVAVTLGATRLFKPEKESLAERTFFEILERLPSSQIMHDVAMGLSLPDATKEDEWLFLSKPEHRPGSFFNTIGLVIGDMVHAQHMRGFGDRMKPQHENWLRTLAPEAA